MDRNNVRKQDMRDVLTQEPSKKTESSGSQSSLISDKSQFEYLKKNVGLKSVLDPATNLAVQRKLGPICAQTVTVTPSINEAAPDSNPLGPLVSTNVKTKATSSMVDSISSKTELVPEEEEEPDLVSEDHHHKVNKELPDCSEGQKVIQESAFKVEDHHHKVNNELPACSQVQQVKEESASFKVEDHHYKVNKESAVVSSEGQDFEDWEEISDQQEKEDEGLNQSTTQPLFAGQGSNEL